MKCPKCGTENWPDATSCGECGAAMDGSEADNHRISELDHEKPNVPNPPTSTLVSAVVKGLKAARIVQMIVFFIVFAFIAVNFLGQMSTPVTMSAAGLVGTWRTASPVAFHIRTDDMDTHEVIELGYEIRNVTLTITPTGDVSTVHVSMSYDVEASTIPQGAYYIHRSPPNLYRGTIDKGTVTLNDGGTSIIHLTYASTSMTGTWDDNTMLGGFIQDVYTEANGITLYRL